MTLGPGISRTQLPQGFYASGVNCGVRRYRPDLGLILSARDAVGAGVFTLSSCAAAPVRYCKSILPSRNIRAILTNSGQANAATGELGELNNQRLADSIALAVDCDPDQVLIASTGVIGQQIDMEKVLPAMKSLAASVVDTAENFALAIMTTDLVPKTVTTTVQLSTGLTRITGICKGSGMIHPNMATMLGYILTDVTLAPDSAQSLIKRVVDDSFNMISVDGDSSTNDCVFLLASGASGVSLSTEQDHFLFEAAVLEVAQVLSQSIAADGEGATKIIEVRIRNADDKAWARKAARSITMSPLIKTAIHGEDPNWGRILARLGAEGISAEGLSRMSLRLQDHLLFAEGAPIAFDRPQVKESLKKHKVVIDIDLRLGNESTTAWGCDLTQKYITINTEYN